MCVGLLVGGSKLGESWRCQLSMAPGKGKGIGDIFLLILLDRSMLVLLL